MKVTEIMYAPLAAEQLAYSFNKAYKTNIEVSDEIIEGSPFVYIDFKDTPPEIIFKYSYKLGIFQNHLATKGESLLPLKDYPLPPDEDEE
jgi:hypothetical protein